MQQEAHACALDVGEIEPFACNGAEMIRWHGDVGWIRWAQRWVVVLGCNAVSNVLRPSHCKSGVGAGAFAIQGLECGESLCARRGAQNGMCLSR